MVLGSLAKHVVFACLVFLFPRVRSSRIFLISATVNCARNIFSPLAGFVCLENYFNRKEYYNLGCNGKVLQNRQESGGLHNLQMMPLQDFVRAYCGSELPRIFLPGFSNARFTNADA